MACLMTRDILLSNSGYTSKHPGYIYWNGTFFAVPQGQSLAVETDYCSFFLFHVTFHPRLDAIDLNLNLLWGLMDCGLYCTLLQEDTHTHIRTHKKKVYQKREN